MNNVKYIIDVLYSDGCEDTISFMAPDELRVDEVGDKLTEICNKEIEDWTNSIGSEAYIKSLDE